MMHFANPYFLFGLFALIIPVIIHLFNFRRHTIFYFSNTRFLKELKQQTNKQSRIRKLILLSLRLLALAALIVAVARPYIQKENRQLSSNATTCIAIYVDNSFSMENTALQGNLLDEAKEKARAIADAYRESDKYMLITNDLEAQHQQFLSRDDFKELLDAVQISSVSQNMTAIYAYVLRDMNRQNTENKLLYFISDFQLTTSDFDDIKLNDALTVYLTPLKANTINNVYIDSLWLSSPAPKFNQQASIHAVIRNSSENDIEKLPVKLFINTNQKALTSVDIAKGGFAEIQLNFTIEEKVIQNGYIEIADYPITFDDKLYFSLSATAQSRIISIVENAENPYLKALFASDSSILYLVSNNKNIDYGTLNQQDLIILEQGETIASGLMQELVQYVKQGGNLVLLPSADVTTYSNDLNAALGISSFGKINTEKTEVASLNLQHILYKNVFEKYPDNINLPVVLQHIELSKELKGNKETAIQLENGDDLLASYQVGEGTVFLLTVGLDDKFSNLQRHAIFVPSLYNMSLMNRQNQIYYTIGKNNSINLRNLSLSGDNVPEIKNENTSFIPEIVHNLQGIQLFVHNQIKDAGNYLLWSNDSLWMGLSFNYNRSESDMHFWDIEQLQSYIASSPLDNLKLLDIQSKSAAAIAHQINHFGTPLHLLFLLFTLLFLLAEAILLRIWK
jgi:hypothetical protein